MTQPGRGQDINLAALWIPVMPETSHMGEEMRKAGGEAKRQFEEGFNSGTSPESMGSNFGTKLQNSISNSMKGFELPFGVQGVFEKLNGEVDKSTAKLQGEASQALQKYREEYDKLTAAQERSTEAEQKIATARAGGFNNASVMLPLMQQQTAAQKELETAHANAGAALEDYNGKATKLSEVTKEASSSSTLMAGVMGGAVVAGVQLLTGAVESLVEHIVEGAVEAFKMGVEGAKEFADKMIELGESYEKIGIQTQEFSLASGHALEDMETHARVVFGSIDVAGENTGKTMAQFASILDAEPSAALDRLTGHVEELQGRYTSLKAQDLGAVFTAFKTPIDQADSALASLLQSARGSGQDLGVLTQALSGDASVTLAQAGMNLQQAGAFMGELLKLGAPGRSVMTGLQAAMKDFGKEGLSFGDGMKLAGDKLKELGDTAAGQDLAEKLFGTRRWATAMAAAQDYVDVIAKGPQAFNANADSMDQFIENTRTLENEWEIVKHKAEEAFMPMGIAALKIVSTGLDRVVAFVDSHMTEIKRDVVSAGLTLIQWGSQLQQFAEGMLQFFAPIVNAIDSMMAGAIAGLGGFARVAGEVLSWIPGFKDMGNGLIDASKGAEAFAGNLQNLNVGQKMKDLSDWLKQHPIDVYEAGQSWVDFASTAIGSMDQVSNATSAFDNGPHGPAPKAPTYGGLPAAEGHGEGAGAEGNSGPGPGTGHYHADWDAIAQKESSGRWNELLPTGIHEGGGLQIKPETWYEFGGLKFSQFAYQTSKENQIAIAERILNGWGSVQGQGPNAWQNGDNYVEAHDAGGPVGFVASGSGMKDDVPALLKRGEYVWDTDSVNKYGWLIKGLHQGVIGFDRGGDPDRGGGIDAAILEGVPMGHYADPGEKRDDLARGMADCSSAIEALVNHLEGGSLTAPSGMYTGNEAAWLLAHGFVPGEGGPGDFRVGFNSHHTQATLPGGTPFNWGSEEAAQRRGIGGTGADDPAFTQHYYMPFRQGGDDQYPGMPGQYGGLGAYGAETYDQQRAAAKAVQEAKDRAADLDHTVEQNQKRIDDLKDQLAQVGTPKTGLLGKPIPLTPEEEKAAADKRKSLQDQLDEATHQLSVSQRERAEQTDNITDAERKQQEAMYKKPSKTGTTKAVGADAFAQLGSSFLGGIGQELGFGDVFGKPPWEWGIVKLLTGAAGYGLNLANSWGDAITGGKTGAAGPAQLGGGSSLFSGLAGSLGINLPKLANNGVSTGPNVVVDPTGTQHGSGQGQLPGPGNVTIDNSINVSPNVDPSAILGPVQEDRNASNSSAFQFQGGLPAS